MRFDSRSWNGAVVAGRWNQVHAAAVRIATHAIAQGQREAFDGAAAGTDSCGGVRSSNATSRIDSYAERMAGRLKATGQQKYANGFDLTLHPASLELPLK